MLESGTRKGPYEIREPLGAGGMGEVYRARDPRLGRDVAIKVSAEQFSERFEREARAVAALNHPNICTLHDVGPDFLVMELVEGPTLAERIRQGAIPVDEALAIADQIAAALEAAHERGIVHRDLKPANVKLTADGSVKVLDFGLAKATDGATDSGVFGTHSPTMTSPADTVLGTILGTAGYMAPEQARGKPVDKRADIWAFGVVLYEMLTGDVLFASETMSDSLAAVLRKEPDLECVPYRVRRLLKQCLQRDPRQRLRDIGDAKLLLEADVEPAREATDAYRGGGGRMWAVLAVLFMVAALAFGFLYYGTARPPPTQTVRFEFVPERTVESVPSISPDGRYVAFKLPVGHGEDHEIHIRPIDAFEAWLVQGTAGAEGVPFWSNDGQWLFFKSRGKLRKVDPFSRVTPQPLADIGGFPSGGATSDDGRVVFGTFGIGGGGIWSVSESGGTTQRLVLPEAGNYAHLLVGMLPGRQFLYWTGQRAGSLRLGSLDKAPEEQPTTSLLDCEPGATYVTIGGAGYLLYPSEGSLLARPFDPARPASRQDVVQVADGLNSGYRVFSATPTALAYMTGERPLSRLVRFDRAGNEIGTIGPAGRYSGISASPDKRLLAASGESSTVSTPHIWIIDPTRESFTRLNTGDDADLAAVFSPDDLVAFTHHNADLYSRPANGAGEAELLVDTEWAKHANDWSRDGRWLIFDEHAPGRQQDLYVVDVQGDRKPIPFLVTDADETLAQFSPDGKWVLYSSNESGRPEIYARDFAPDRVPAHGDQKVQVSVNGGDKPRWSPDGAEVYYLEELRRMMAVEVTVGQRLEIGLPETLFEATTRGFVPYDVVGPGEFVVSTVPAEEAGPAPPLAVVLNWGAGLGE